MKTLTLFLALSFYLLATPTHSTSNHIRLPTVLSDSPVLDSDGDELRPGVAYYINSISRGAAARGVKLGRLDSNTKCPSDVLAIFRLVYNEGDPVTFTPADPNATVILPSTYQSISFDVSLPNRLCRNKLTWRVQYDRGSGKHFLRAGEFVSNLSNQFKIEADSEFSNDYKFTYCLFDECYNVGLFYDESSSVQRFALSEFSFRFSFRKANKAAEHLVV